MPEQYEINRNIKVPESVIQQIREMGMGEAIKHAQSGKASKEFIEGVRRFYPGFAYRSDQALRGERTAAREKGPLSQEIALAAQPDLTPIPQQQSVSDVIAAIQTAMKPPITLPGAMQVPKQPAGPQPVQNLNPELGPPPIDPNAQIPENLVKQPVGPQAGPNPLAAIAESAMPVRGALRDFGREAIEPALGMGATGRAPDMGGDSSMMLIALLDAISRRLGTQAPPQRSNLPVMNPVKTWTGP